MSKIIFVVDDSLTNLSAAEAALEDYYTVMTIPSGERAISLLDKVKPDLILLDIEMPEMSGFDVLSYIKYNEKFRDIPVIFLTAMLDEKIEIKALQMGIVDFITKPFSTPVLLNRIRLHLDMSSVIRERTMELNHAKQDIIFVLADVVENRDESTGDHLGRTSRLVKMLIETMRQQNIYLDLIKDWDDYLIAECSLMHDVGKISTPDAILRKPGKLTPEEFEIMKQHTVAGERLLNKVIARSGENVFLHHSKIFAISHHERWNGTGYPHGLKGDEIPLQGRIMAIVDVYDALISERVYKKAYTEEETLALILGEKGKHFDPLLVDVLFSIKDRVRKEIYHNG